EKLHLAKMQAIRVLKYETAGERFVAPQPEETIQLNSVACTTTHDRFLKHHRPRKDCGHIQKLEDREARAPYKRLNPPWAGRMCHGSTTSPETHLRSSIELQNAPLPTHTQTREAAGISWIQYPLNTEVQTQTEHREKGA